MSPSAIEWTDETWNPTTGCDRVSPGCDNCYALTMAGRLKAMGQDKYQHDGDPKTSGPGFGLTEHEDVLEAPLRWRKPRMVFVNSMSDLFHPRVSDLFLERVWGVMVEAQQHTFQILTKRPARMRAFVTGLQQRHIDYAAMFEDCPTENMRTSPAARWAVGAPDELIPPRNIWLGTSIENDRYAFRADSLRNTPAAVRFLSLEPLLGPLPSLDLTGIDWVIVGGESGPGARPMHIDSVREIRDRCWLADIPFFFKQWGGATPKAGGKLLDGREWCEFPESAVSA